MLASTKTLFLTALCGFILFQQGPSRAQGRYLASNQTATSVDRDGRAEELLQEALLLSGTKGHELASARLSEAMQLWSQMNQAEKAAGAAIRLGDRYAHGGRFRESLNCYEQALDVRALDNQMRAAAHNAMARVYSGLYQRDLALRSYRQAITLTRPGKDGSVRAAALTGLAEICHREGDRKQALAYIAEAQSESRQSGIGGEGALAFLAGSIHLEEGYLDPALRSLEQALAIFRLTGDELGQVKAICAISNLYLLSGEAQQAAQQADLAVDLAERQASRMVDNAGALKAAEMRGRAWFSHGRASRVAGKKENAIRSFRKAIFYFEGLYWSIFVSSELSAIAFREELQAPYRELVDLLIEQGRSREAFEWAEHARARVMLGISEARRKSEPRVRALEGDALRVLSESTARLRAQLGSPRISRKHRVLLERRIKSAQEALDDARLKLEMQRSRKRLAWFEPVGIKTLQERLAGTGELLLEFLVGENRSFVWLLSAGDVSLEILPGRKEIEKQVVAFLKAIRTAPNNLRLGEDLTLAAGSGEKLLATLFGEMYNKLPRGKKLIIVRDGLLHNLPFEALAHSGRYLVEDYEISYIPSASMLEMGRDSSGIAPAEHKMEILAVGDPDFGYPKSLRTGLRGRNPNVMRQARVSRGFDLARLPRTRDEVEDIAGLFPPERRRVYLGLNATEGAVKAESLRQFRRLHFATHGLIDDVSPSRSAVVLSQTADQKEDGFLEVGEISELDLDCDLVVLSACQTGRGWLLSGEGVIGLSRAFLYAGARAVVVSLWNVSEISTSLLMKSFYRHLAGGAGNAAALRSAKLQMLKSGNETRHPYYWSPFITIGKP